MKKNYSIEELINLSKNFTYIVQIGPLSKDDLIKGEKIETPICSENTYNRIYSFKSSETKKTWCPQQAILNNIVKYFNRYFRPKICVYDLFNTILENIKDEFFKIEDYKSDLRWYEGVYHCYYLENKENYHFGIIKIYHTKNGNFQCEAALGFNEKEFKNFKSYAKKDCIIKNICIKYRNDNNIGYEVPFIYYSGEILQLAEDIVIELAPESKAFLKILVMRRYDNKTERPSYLGGTGIMITTHRAYKPLKIQVIGLSKNDISNETNKIKQFLDFKIKSNNMITSNEENNQEWFEFIMGRNS